MPGLRARLFYDARLRAPAATAQAVDIKAPEVVAPKLDLNAFIGKLTSPDFQQQESGMEAIAELAKNSPAQATELVDVKVIESLLGIMEKDSSKLEGPTPQQLQIREKIMTKQAVTEPEMAEASKITPMEQAERNKQYAIYTVAILQKLYGTEIQKMSLWHCHGLQRDLFLPRRLRLSHRVAGYRRSLGRLPQAEIRWKYQRMKTTLPL